MVSEEKRFGDQHTHKKWVKLSVKQHKVKKTAKMKNLKVQRNVVLRKNTSNKILKVIV